METKLTSIRLEAETIKKIDDFCKNRTYYKRTLVINKILRAVLQCCSYGDFWKIMKSWDPYGDGLTISVTEKIKEQQIIQ